MLCIPHEIPKRLTGKQEFSVPVVHVARTVLEDGVSEKWKVLRRGFEPEEVVEVWETLMREETS